MLLTDGAGEFTGQSNDFVKHSRWMCMQLQKLEQIRNNQNQYAEHDIGLLPKRWRRQITNKMIPKRLWDFGIVYEDKLL